MLLGLQRKVILHFVVSTSSLLDVEIIVLQMQTFASKTHDLKKCNHALYPLIATINYMAIHLTINKLTMHFAPMIVAMLTCALAITANKTWFGIECF